MNPYLLHRGSRGKGAAAPFPCTPNPRRPGPPLRSGQILLDHSEHLLHNHHASVASLRLLFTFAPERRSASLRKRCSPSPESPGGFGCSRFNRLIPCDSVGHALPPSHLTSAKCTQSPPAVDKMPFFDNLHRIDNNRVEADLASHIRRLASLPKPDSGSGYRIHPRHELR